MGCPYCGEPFYNESSFRLAVEHIDNCRVQLETAVMIATMPEHVFAELLRIEAVVGKSPDYQEFYQHG
jgi:hypothetical protein